MKLIGDGVTVFVAAFLCVLCYVFILVAVPLASEYYKGQLWSAAFGLSCATILLVRIKHMHMGLRILSLLLILIAVTGAVLAIVAVYRYY
jgi:hypothetical protein